MKLVLFTIDEQTTRLGALRADGIVDITALGTATDLHALITASAQTLQLVANEVASPSRPLVPLSSVRLCAPLSRPSKIVAVGLNYLDHCREQHVEPPKQPLIFSKFPSTLTGPSDPIVWNPALTHEVDPEVELGVIIGQRTRNISEEQALDVVFGYTVVNDVSARDLQFGDGQWTRGKSLDTFCPLGPAIVTADEVADPQALSLRCLVNDRVTQDSSTTEMIFSIRTLIAHISRFCTLEPRDLILTGTPYGVGCFRTPPVYLQAEDVVVCEIDGIGRLENRAQTSPGVEA
jgi:5-carboxymethyl-2-hydroxymuconate isomerase